VRQKLSPPNSTLVRFHAISSCLVAKDSRSSIRLVTVINLNSGLIHFIEKEVRVKFRNQFVKVI
jgi:hypothetical protein